LVVKGRLPAARRLARGLGSRGLINIQFVIHEGQPFIIEANPRASRTVPIISKVTGVNLVAAATRVALGERLADMPYGTGLIPEMPYVTVKVPVFSFAKMRGVETILGPEMKSTGEVLGIDDTFGGALRKGFVAAGIRVPDPNEKGRRGRILVSIADAEKEEGVAILRRYAALGFTLVATDGTYLALTGNGIDAERINKIADGSPHVLDAIASRAVDLVINDAAGPRELSDGYRIRRAAVEASIACLTSLDTARALVQALESTAGPPRTLQEYRESVARV
jgi:carbamoyl-phosphate synthase large subunit